MNSYSPIQIQDLGLQREGRWLFRHLHLDVEPGKFIALVGASGVGKSSLLHTLAGLLTPTEGSITYECSGRCKHTPKNFQKKIGVIFQKLSLIPNNTVLQNVLCGRLGRYAWWKTLFSFPQSDRAKAYEILKNLNIHHLTEKWVSQTSGGEQQRAAIARTLLQEPELILADEPVAHLDMEAARHALQLIKNQSKKLNAITLCSLHHPELIDEFADLMLELSPDYAEGWKLHRKPI